MEKDKRLIELPIGETDWRGNSVLFWCVRSCSVQFNSVARLWLTLCEKMHYCTPGLPVHHQLLEFNQTHVHWVSDSIHPSHPLLSLLLPLSIFPSIRVSRWVISSLQVTKILEFQLQHQSWLGKSKIFRASHEEGQSGILGISWNCNLQVEFLL